MTHLGIPERAAISTDSPGRRPRLAAPGPAPGWAPTEAVARRDARLRRVVAFADALAAALALLVTMLLVGVDHPAVAALSTVPLIVLAAKVIGVYDRQASLVRNSTLDEVPLLLQLATLYALIVWLLNGLILTGSSTRQELLVNWIALSVLLIVLRALARLLVRHTTTPERCLVIGDGPTCARIRTKLAKPSLHSAVVAHIPIGTGQAEHRSMEALAGGTDLVRAANLHRVDRIMIAPEHADADEVLNVIRHASSLGVKVSVVPRLLEVVGSSGSFDEVEGIPLLSMRSARLSRSSWMIKRALDLTASLVGLALCSPVLVAIAVAIELESGGPCLFRQLRIGRDGKAFEMLKFRTMVHGADKQRDALAGLNESDGLFKIARDPRLTRVGRLLRTMSLDELPQLWNVVRGDMSLVGPRPLVLEEDLLVEGWYRRRLQLTPGMTGPWQILGSGRVPLREMVNIDYLYAVNWSLWNDLKILLRTVPYVVRRRNV